jgi:hypothetical protein
VDSLLNAMELDAREDPIDRFVQPVGDDQRCVGAVRHGLETKQEAATDGRGDGQSETARRTARRRLDTDDQSPEELVGRFDAPRIDDRLRIDARKSWAQDSRLGLALGGSYDTSGSPDAKRERGA